MTTNDVHKKSENEKRYAIVKWKINVKCIEGARETSNVCWFRSKVVAHRHTSTHRFVWSISFSVWPLPLYWTTHSTDSHFQAQTQRNMSQQPTHIRSYYYWICKRCAHNQASAICGRFFWVIYSKQICFHDLLLSKLYTACSVWLVVGASLSNSNTKTIYRQRFWCECVSMLVWWRYE